MKVTYLGLNLLAILVQFTVVKSIERKIKGNTDSDNGTISSLNENANVYEKPQALYYRSLANNLKKSTTEYLNVSLLQTTTDSATDLTTTVIDELYDENTSLAGTTDVTYTTTELENVTEISLFDKNNHTNVKPNIIPKKTSTEDCSCNLLFKICDINCCCDIDCSDSDLKMFKCGEVVTNINQDEDSCHLHLQYLYWQYGNKIIDMFCIAKTNLPERRNINRVKNDRNMLDRTYKWHSEEKHQSPNTFKRKPYMYGDHVWVLKNGSIKYMDLPIPVLNDYCTGRKALTFLKEETIQCRVKLKDLEMFEIIKASQEATLVSVTDITSSTSKLNCSTLHCTNWTIIVCEGAKCVNYNQSIHEPSCTDDITCTNLAFEFDYIFYFHDGKILNATIKLHTQKALSTMIQKINVRFVIANETITNIVRMSGNPGYLDGMPLIVSYVKENHSDNFYNSTSSDRYIVHPQNYNGICRITNDTNNFLTFNINKRMKCRFQYDKGIKLFNDTNACHNINKNILELLGVNKNIFVSPFGNPLNLNDKDWIPILNAFVHTEPINGEYNEKGSKLHCYNMITRMSYIFTFADIGENNKRKIKILTGKINLVAGNVTFNIKDPSVVLTIDTMFIDETKPCLYEYAAGPHLNIHLPKDFFFPFHDNGSNNLRCNVVISIVLFIIQQIK